MKILSKIVTSILISGLTTAAIFTPPQPAARDSLSSAIEKQLDANAALPASYAIVDGEDITFGSREGAGPDTPFVVGSVSKSFTALAVMVAVERGEVSLDAPVTDYLPDFRLKASGAEPIRIRHLLSHTSGISTVDCYLDSSTPLETVEARVDQLRSVTPESRPGERFIGLAEGHTTVMGFPISRPEDGAESALADGYLIPTARDLATYAQFQMGDGRTRDGNPLISVDLLHEMHRGTIAVPGSEGTELANYAMGWFTAIVNGITVVTHGGTTPRYHANVAMVPSEHRAVIALVAGQWLSGAGSTSSGAVGLLLKQDAGVSQMYRIVTALLWLVTLLLMVTLVAS
ncbi:MAG: serine hydrolase domain-containing protein [Nakamurella sp.]